MSNSTPSCTYRCETLRFHLDTQQPGVATVSAMPRAHKSWVGWVLPHQQGRPRDLSYQMILPHARTSTATHHLLKHQHVCVDGYLKINAGIGLALTFGTLT